MHLPKLFASTPNTQRQCRPAVSIGVHNAQSQHHTHQTLAERALGIANSGVAGECRVRELLPGLAETVCATKCASMASSTNSRYVPDTYTASAAASWCSGSSPLDSRNARCVSAASLWSQVQHATSMGYTVTRYVDVSWAAAHTFCLA